MALPRRVPRSTELHNILFAAGVAAMQWYEDTDDCHFCNPTPEGHEEHCPLRPAYQPVEQ